MTNDSQLPHRASSGRDWGQLLVRLLGWVLALAFLVLVIAIVRIFYWQQLPAVYPPGPSAIRPDQTLAATTAVSSQPDVRAEDLVLTMAPTHSSAYRLYVEGRSFFPIILSDLQAAQSSIHIEIYGFEPGDLADQFNPVLKERAGAGVDVRIIVDRMGSGVSGRNTGAMFDELAAAGVQIVTNDPLPPDRVGLIGQQSLAPGVRGIPASRPPQDVRGRWSNWLGWRRRDPGLLLRGQLPGRLRAHRGAAGRPATDDLSDHVQVPWRAAAG